MELLLIGIVIVALPIVLFILMKNNAIAKHENVIRVWADIDAVLLQRHEQIKQQLNLIGQVLNVETKAYQKIAKYRSGLDDYPNMSINEKIDFNANLGAFITHGLRHEAYPDVATIKEVIPRLLTMWNSIETEIKNKRLAYNRSATSFNIGLHQFPSSMFFTKARMLLSENGTAEPFALIKATAQEREAVNVPEPDWTGMAE